MSQAARCQRSVLTLEGIVSSSCSGDGVCFVSTLSRSSHFIRATADGLHHSTVSSLDGTAPDNILHSSYAMDNYFLVTASDSGVYSICNETDGSQCHRLCTIPEELSSPIVSMEHHSGAHALMCSTFGAAVVDVSCGAIVSDMSLPYPTCIAATSPSSGNSVAVVTYDGFVLYFDARVRGSKGPYDIRQVPGEHFCSYSGREDGALAVGTASGRVFTLRGASSIVEQAFSTGSRRSAIRTLKFTSQQLLTGHVDGTVTASMFASTALAPSSRANDANSLSLKSSKNDRRNYAGRITSASLKSFVPLPSDASSTQPFGSADDWNAMAIEKCGLQAWLMFSSVERQMSYVVACEANDGGILMF